MGAAVVALRCVGLVVSKFVSLLSDEFGGGAEGGVIVGREL